MRENTTKGAKTINTPDNEWRRKTGGTTADQSGEVVLNTRDYQNKTEDY